VNPATRGPARRLPVVSGGGRAADALTLAVLVAGCVGVYGVAVLGAFTVFGPAALPQGKPAPVVAIAATAAVAVMARPLHRLAREIALRLLKGRGGSPYDALATFGRRVAAVPDVPGALAETARIAGMTTGASRADLWVWTGGRWSVASSWSRNGDAAPDRPADGSVWVPLDHRDQMIGALSVSMPAGQPPSAEARQLLHDLGPEAALVLHATRLVAQLRAQVDGLTRQNAELAAARTRVLTAADDERRRLQRDLAAGPLRELAAMRTALPAGELAALRRLADRGIESLRDVARGVYPPILRDSGVARALLARYRHATADVTVDAAGLERLPLESELMLYEIGCDVVDTAIVQGARQVTLRLAREVAGVRLTVTDDGSAEPRHGDLQLAADRAVAASGTLRVVTRQAVVELPVEGSAR
jgi:signal transduction histidine kinase